MLSLVISRMIAAEAPKAPTSVTTERPLSAETATSTVTATVKIRTTWTYARTGRRFAIGSVAYQARKPNSPIFAIHATFTAV